MRDSQRDGSSGGGGSISQGEDDLIQYGGGMEGDVLKWELGGEGQPTVRLGGWSCSCGCKLERARVGAMGTA